ncbi:MFS transporter [Paracoccus methylarcula]|uniref:MFS transporter n=1 Tax=Paracoccus methylarcula TaxID=72022 RepID=A0A422QTG0_9RHOB|nr:MFS transporter [Paracoccus methylarcula]RNF33061.1 MFS transporter [Paracoccus methylarcula]
MTDAARISIPILIALAAATLTASLGISVASVLLPTLTRSFAATVSEVQWVVLAYLISVTIAIVSAGRLGDLFGHRHVLISGLVIFTTASILCALAPNLGLLIAGRTLQGFGGAILIALPMSIARDIVPAGRLGTAMGLLGTTSAAGTALGPSLGGALLTWGDWRMAFWLLAGFATVALVLSVGFIARNSTRTGAAVRDLDFPGTFMLVIALAAYALATSGGANGIPVPTGLLISGAVISIILFVFIETRAASPLVPMALLLDRRIGTGLIMNIVVSTAMMSTLVVGPFFLAFALELNEAVIGLVMAVGPLVAAFSGVPAGRLTDRIGVNRAMAISLAQTMLGLLCLAFLPRYFGVGGYVAALFTLTPGFQLFFAANNTALLVNASKEQRGRLSGLLGLSRNLGLMTGASAMPTLFVTILGTGDAAQAPAADVAHAFSMTFAAAAGLAILALGMAIRSHTGFARETPGPAE